MVVRTEKRMVEVFDTTYVANDGTEFKTEFTCLDYEKQLAENAFKAKANELRIPKFDGTYPLDVDGQYISDNHAHTWYQVNTEEDLNTLEDVYGGIGKPCSYPDIVCIETDDYYTDDCWSYWLSDMKKSTVAFWKAFGYEVEFKEGSKDSE